MTSLTCFVSLVCTEREKRKEGEKKKRFAMEQKILLKVQALKVQKGKKKEKKFA